MPDTKQGQTAPSGQSGQKDREKHASPRPDLIENRKPQGKEAGHRDNR